MKKVWHDEAWDQFCGIIQRNAKMAKRINDLLKSIDRNGYQDAAEEQRVAVAYEDTQVNEHSHADEEERHKEVVSHEIDTLHDGAEVRHESVQ